MWMEREFRGHPVDSLASRAEDVGDQGTRGFEIKVSERTELREQ
jgi:hypothetical protein